MISFPWAAMVTIGIATAKRYRKVSRPPVQQWRATCACGWRDHELRVRVEAGQALARHQLATGCRRDGKAEREPNGGQA